MSQTFDAIVIGTGQAGPPLAERLSKAGWRVAIVERDRFGGTCVNTGCIPTKALVASAHVAALARRAAEFGVKLPSQVEIDFKAVMARKDRIAGRSSQNVERWVRGLEHARVLTGHARLESARRVRVGDEVLESEHIFLNVGGHADQPPIEGLDGIDYLTNSSLMRLDRLPEHLVVVGGSYVGLEFAQMFRRFGAQVTVVQRDAQLMPREDPDVAKTVLEIIEREGIDVRLKSECIRVERLGDLIRVGSHCEGGNEAVQATHVLIATGRRPNTDELGLENAGVRVDARGFIEVDEQLRTNVDGIWALGDCNGRGAFTHTSYNDFEIVAANLLDQDPRRVSDRIPAYALYTDPALGRIGMTETEVRRSGRPALIGYRPMSRVGRAVQKGEEHGFIKVLVDAQTKALLGATILGVEGDEVVQAMLPLMYAKAPVTVMQRSVHIHPTVAELLPTVFGDLKPLDAG